MLGGGHHLCGLSLGFSELGLGMSRRGRRRCITPPLARTFPPCVSYFRGRLGDVGDLLAAAGRCRVRLLAERSISRRIVSKMASFMESVMLSASQLHFSKSSEQVGAEEAFISASNRHERPQAGSEPSRVDADSRRRCPGTRRAALNAAQLGCRYSTLPRSARYVVAPRPPSS